MGLRGYINMDILLEIILNYRDYGIIYYKKLYRYHMGLYIIIIYYIDIMGFYRDFIGIMGFWGL